MRGNFFSGRFLMTKAGRRPPTLSRRLPFPIKHPVIETSRLPGKYNIHKIDKSILHSFQCTIMAKMHKAVGVTNIFRI
jgi:hypothetical protein